MTNLTGGHVRHIKREAAVQIGMSCRAWVFGSLVFVVMAKARRGCHHRMRSTCCGTISLRC